VDHKQEVSSGGNGVSEQDELDSSGSEPAEDMIAKAVAEGPLPGIKDQEAAEAELAEQTDTPVGQRPEDEADELGGFNLRA
jgi:hypothetical protein